ncbi:uncharacterized LOC729966 homolog [Heteronotia binoei]|uniref:uncharacterized LOC729966 homolog n=1 Tax=Heteronotia binoei TaxID=13085 RepID=UPI00292DDCB6|nr:uncharacterized LOC729966 homolog [Heteronotia binoei]
MALLAPLLLAAFLQVLPLSEVPPVATAASSPQLPSSSQGLPATTSDTHASSPSTESSSPAPSAASLGARQTTAANRVLPLSEAPPVATASSSPQLPSSSQGLPATTSDTHASSPSTESSSPAPSAASLGARQTTAANRAGPTEEPPLQRNPGLVAVVCIFISILAIGTVVILVKSCRPKTSAFKRLDEVPLAKVTEESPFARHSVKEPTASSCASQGPAGYH